MRSCHPTPPTDEDSARRLRGFVGHLLGYFTGMAIIVPLVGWGAALGLHAAHVMGFFDLFRGR